MNDTSPEALVDFSAALRAFKLPLANQEFLAALEQRIPCLGCKVLDGYIKYFREDKLPALEIHYGYTNGFQSEQEVIQIFGDVDRSESTRVSNIWWVTHPENKIRESGRSRSMKTSEETYCPGCGMSLPKSQQCEFCI